MFLLLLTGLAYGKERIAILNSNSLNKNITYEDIDFISEEIRSAIFYSISRTKYDLMQKETITEFLRDNDMSYCTSTCEIETGRVLGADYILTSSIYRLDDVFNLKIKVFDIEDGSTLDMFDVSSSTIYDLSSEISNIDFAKVFGKDNILAQHKDQLEALEARNAELVAKATGFDNLNRQNINYRRENIKLKKEVEELKSKDNIKQRDVKIAYKSLIVGTVLGYFISNYFISKHISSQIASEFEQCNDTSKNICWN
jgi:hypothetical protein